MMRGQLAAACLIGLLIAGWGSGEREASAAGVTEQAFIEEATTATCAFAPRQAKLKDRLARALETRGRGKSERARARSKLRRVGHLLPAFESFYGDLAEAMRGVEAPAGPLHSIWRRLTAIEDSLEADARRADRRVRAGNLISAYAFLSALAYKSEVAADLSREAGFAGKCPGEAAAGSE